METPRHLGHHEVARELPLVTDSGTVTLVEAMDHNCVRAARNAIMDVLDEDVLPGWVTRGTTSDRWNELRTAVRTGDVGARTAADVETLVDRIQRAYPSLVRIRVALADPLNFAPGSTRRCVRSTRPAPTPSRTRPTTTNGSFASIGFLGVD